MKTIDVLVEELPKRGGWPDGAIGAGFLSGEGALYFWDKNNNCPPKWTIDTDIEVEDSDEEITREQYEAALAAKNEGWIEWGGGKHPRLAQIQLWMSNLRRDMYSQDARLASIHGSTFGEAPTSSPTVCTSRRKQRSPKLMKKPT